MSQRPDPVAGRERFKDHAGPRTHIQGIDLDPVARPRHRVRPGFAHGVRPWPQPPPGSGNSVARRFDQPAVRLAMKENPTQQGSGNRHLRAAQQNGQLVFAPAGKRQPQSQNLASTGKGQVGRRIRRGRWRRSSRVVKSYGSYPLPPAIKGLARDPEMRGRAEPRSPCCPTNPSRLSAPAPSGLTPLPLRPTAPSEVAFLPEFAC